MTKPKTARNRTRAKSSFVLGAEPLPEWKEAKRGLERWMLEQALTGTGGNMAEAGRRLGITKVAVLHAVRRHRLEHLPKRRI